MNRQNIVSVRFNTREIQRLEEISRFLERSRSETVRRIVQWYFVANMEKPKDTEEIINVGVENGK